MRPEKNQLYNHLLVFIPLFGGRRTEFEMKKPHLVFCRSNTADEIQILWAGCDLDIFLRTCLNMKWVISTPTCSNTEILTELHWLSWGERKNLGMTARNGFWKKKCCAHQVNNGRCCLFRTCRSLPWTSMISPLHTKRAPILREISPGRSKGLTHVLRLFLVLATSSTTSWVAVQMREPRHSLRSHSSTFVFLWGLQAEWGSKRDTPPPPPLLPPSEVNLWQQQFKENVWTRWRWGK